MNTLKLLSFAAVAGCLATLHAQELNVTVPAAKAPSRDAQFNWKFESSGGGKIQSGQFACGSYWVAPAAGDKGVKLLSLTGTPQQNDLLSCDVDPIPANHGLLNGARNYGSHNPDKNIIPRLPITYTPATGSCISLVAAMQRNEAETSEARPASCKGEVADAYCVVTIMPSPPANGGRDMIRPNITGATKEFLTWADFDLSRLPSLDFIKGQDEEGWAKTQLVWRSAIEIFGMDTEIEPGKWTTASEGGRAFRARLLIDDYASGMAASFNAALLALFSTDDIEQKKIGLAAMLAFGSDIYHARYDSGNGPRVSWSSGAGQRSGQYLPAVLLAALQRNEAKADALRKTAITNHGADPAQRGPQELRQLTRGVTGVLLWGDGTPIERKGNEMTEMDWRYWTEMKSSACFDGAVGNPNPNQGKKTLADPYGYIDGPANSPGSAYMSVSFGAVQALASAMILMPSIRSVVNTDDPIEYADRLTRHGLWTSPDPVAAPTLADQTNGSTTWFSAQGCEDWGVKWGPRPEDIRFAIEDGKGRFTSKHGAAFKGGYGTARAEDNWAQIIALYKGDRFENNAVPLDTLVSPEILFETGGKPMVHLRSPNPDAVIRYTLDGSEPTKSSAVYQNPIPVKAGVEVNAKAFQEGKKDSAVRKKTFVASVK